MTGWKKVLASGEKVVEWQRGSRVSQCEAAAGQA